MMNSVFFIIFLSSFSIFFISNADDMSSLLSVKSMLNDPLNSLHNWNSDTRLCSWTGIECSSSNSIISLNLSHMNLTGNLSSSLPETLSNLTTLEILDISVNSFEGKFPTGFNLCTNLKVFNASGNNFDGDLPEDISQLASLEILDFRGTFFGGYIPKSYKNLKSLKFLGLSGNSLSGKIPEELGQLSSLEKLIIGYNNFEGGIPKELSNLSNLQYLDIAFANLEGELPAELGKLKTVNTVYLYKNNLKGQIPKEISNLTELALLDLSDNQLSGFIPSEISQLSNLKLLNLMCNRLTGEVPVGIGELKNLQVLELWNNSLTGSLPSNLGSRSSSLQWVDVSSNSLTGEIPSDLCIGQNLTKLIMFNNGFSGPIPISLSSCPSLVRVRVHNNSLNGTIPDGFGKLPKLQRLELANNNLEGGIPTDLAVSTSLSFIDLSHNKLYSQIPSNILAIPSLQNFMVSYNKLSGEIPDHFQDYPSLSALDLSSNNLSGSIPETIGSCQKLVYLNLSHNNIEGNITAAMTSMSTLAILDLSNNQLTGTIPENLGSSPALESINLSYNNLTGHVPGILKTMNPDELAGNPFLSDATEVQPANKRSEHIKRSIAGWAMGITAAICVGVILFAFKLLYKRWYVENSNLEENEAWPWRLIAFQRLGFASSDILSCVTEDNVIGMGASGVVYKAKLQKPSTVIAVKKLWRGENIQNTDITGEVSILGKLRHRNIVRLLGYMHNDRDTMILYEHMPGGSLWEALHGTAEQRVLVDWVSRYNVATGVAQGLAYLHHDCRPPVVHRDVKSSNVLLDGNLEARIADFGLAKIIIRKNETASMVAGSYGYIAPEYGYTLKVDEKSDVYSFGVVLMELVTGKRAVESEYGEFHDIVGWIREKCRDNRGLEVVLDESLGTQCKHVQEEMLLVLRVSMLCTAKLPKDRPSMRDVVSMLGEAKPRRKSSSNSGSSVEKDKPVFTASPTNEFV